MHNRFPIFQLALVALLGAGACNVDYSNRGRPDGGGAIDSGSIDADTAVIAEASGPLNGSSVEGSVQFAATATNVTATIELTRAPENPEHRGVRIMTGTCDDGQEGDVWEFGDLGDMEIVEVAPHTGGGEHVVQNASWEIGTDGAADVVGKIVVIFNDSGAGGTIDSCGVIAQD